VSEEVEEDDNDVQQRVGVVEGCKGVRVIVDTTLEIMCEIWARSLGMLGILDIVDTKAEANSR
jgi:hypothetical protein